VSNVKSYNPQKARTKYACPIWVDAFLRDTLDLEADEFGAYHLILYAMWSREACNMPDDDRKLARVSRCSTKLWKSRIRPSLEPFFNVDGGVWTNTRLSKEAAKTEKFLKGQSDRKTGSGNESDPYAGTEETQPQEIETPIIPDKALKTIDRVSTVDDTTGQSGEHPTQDTKIPRYKIDDDDSAGDGLTFREKVCLASGHDASGVMANSKIFANRGDFAEFETKRIGLGLSEANALDAIADAVQAKQGDPPTSLRYFTKPMQDFAGKLNAEKVEPTSPRQSQQSGLGYKVPRPDFPAEFKSEFNQ
tara:strand:+ start:48104 stop:49018 length:915 start_codon:yes stop_codon:yes gene_type:complete